MKRSEYFMQMLDAAASMQYNISMILEAKANEAAKSRDWILNHLNHLTYDNHADQLKQPLAYHEQFVELIDGLTKLEAALGKNLTVVLNKKEPMSSGLDGGGFGGLFGGMGDDS
ncbi:restriction endonuclease subunit S [Paenibacillus koleovorans]|uniref:restriction endonuclease subunit S n=1 Tax=Paenibacillus koleovorans TaxID=121608 RepID=UPI000FD9A5FB|nr:restriction endonuclease subunit S [Paenibacillus koleovorans]